METTQSRVVRFHEIGSADVLKIESMPISDPGEGEIRIKVQAIGLNRAEIMFREGQYLEVPEVPCRLGYEASGIVDAIGEGVSGFSIGDRVSTIPSFSQGKYGVYGEIAIVPATAVAHYPPNLSATEGTAIWMQYLTAYGGLIEVGQLTADHVLLVTAASSSVGLAATQIAKHIGATVVAITRGNEKRQPLLDAGADHVIATNDADLVESVMSLTDGKGANLAFDPIGGSMLSQLAETATPGGMIIEYGALSPEPTVYPLFAALGKGLTVRGYVLFEITTQPEKLAKAKQFIFDGLESGALCPVIDKSFEFKDIADAHRYMESNTQFGKIVATV
ncbi:NADPH:quinone reductase [Candidatus Thiodiazotropha endoloripes]|uniref:zinc-dependent alcohol dehydrogenase family protein n=1 Tax=Candidatus Thiodiazotropha endoloripes TaxID=1818881 RepID=UPI00083DFCEC|nr:zinc-dependent alcohol dehydrogenase family protein [Candidatus Thiodiazotropha endoloripes]MCG7984632.1 zinc-dependent alcohol dehydrogenase family protein [Candidatus Thiodiazotropha lotti]ODB85699.1 NADPH:quinone reductase [Candidatus Thiodiazotropha endoloripes]